LKVSGSDEFRGFNAVSTSYRFHGLLRLDDEGLTLEWGGVAQVQQVGMSIRDDRLPLPDERLTLPVSYLYPATLDGGWWRSRLVLRARVPGALAAVPSEDLGTVACWYARSDRSAARDLANALRAAIAGAPSPGLDSPEPLPRLEATVSTPPEGHQGP
jgi:hypothetical protein